MSEIGEIAPGQLAIEALGKQLEHLPLDGNSEGKQLALKAIENLSGVALVSQEPSVRIAALNILGKFNSLQPETDLYNSAHHNADELKRESNHLAAAIGVTSKDDAVQLAAIDTMSKSLGAFDAWGHVHDEAVVWVAAVGNSGSDSVRKAAIEVLSKYTTAKEVNLGHGGKNVHAEPKQKAIELIGVLGAS